MELADIYRSYRTSKTNFKGLEEFLDIYLSDQQFERFFVHILPAIIKLALRLPSLCPEPIPLLIPEKTGNITLTQLQIASLLANAFLCTFPPQGGPISLRESTSIDSPPLDDDPEREESRDDKKGNANKKKRRPKYPVVNFDRLFEAHYTPSQNEKLMCVFTYFDIISKRMEDTKHNWKNVSFSRVFLAKGPEWGTSARLISRENVTVLDSTAIEDLHTDLQADFANQFIGGGVLGKGCIQEEIRFMVNFECIVSLLFTAKLEDNECAYIRGPERYSDYSGYSYQFKFEGPFTDKTPVDSQGFLDVEIVAFDALYFGSNPESRIQQYYKSNLLREMNKAYLAFSQPIQKHKKDVATGNWGCGAFGGYHDLKAVIQILAAVELQIGIKYCTFGVKGLAPCIEEFLQVLVENQVTVGMVWKELEKLAGQIEFGEEAHEMPQLFTWLIEAFEQE